MRIAILDPFSGIAGDMCLGALVDAGLDEAFIHALPAALGLEGIGVQITRVSRGQLACRKVDFAIPPQPHGRHLKHIAAIVEASATPDAVKRRAMDAFTRITECEAAIHGTTVEKVHLHEVGSVDAILDIVGTIWGLQRLGVERVFATTISLGDGFVETSHGRMAVPTAATLRLLEGLAVRPGPEGAGELVTPTGAVLVRVLSEGPPPLYVPRASGFGAGTKDFKDRANALRIVLADVDVADVADTGTTETLTLLAADLDDATGEEIARVGDLLRESGALDVVLLPSVMKKGRPGVRLEMLARPGDAARLQALLLSNSTTIGVRWHEVHRRALARVERSVDVFGHQVRMKVVTLPDGSTRAKPESDDVVRVAAATGRSQREVADAARSAARN